MAVRTPRRAQIRRSQDRTIFRYEVVRFNDSMGMGDNAGVSHHLFFKRARKAAKKWAAPKEETASVIETHSEW